MRHFYVRVRSDYDHAEFPNNSSNHFHNRLPFPLRFHEEGWQVALHSISVPKAPIVFTLTDKFLCRFIWYIDEYDDMDHDATSKGMELNLNDLKVHLTGGRHLIKAIIDKYWHHLRDETHPDFAYIDRRSEKRYYPILKLEGDEMIIDNSDTYLGDQNTFPRIEFGTEFAKKMGWITSAYKLGPNLRKEFPTDIIPTPTDLKEATDPNEEAFYEADGDSLKLSCFCNWHFLNLDEAFTESYGDSKRLLYVNSNVGEASIVGGLLTPLLKEIPYSEEERQYQVNELAYVSVRSGVLDILQVEVTELSGQPVQFNQGYTHVVLTFKHDY